MPIPRSLRILDPGSWAWARALSSSLQVAPEIKEADHGASSGSNHPKGPTYPPVNGMSALSAFSDVHAAIVRRARDLATVPIRVYDRDPVRDPAAEVIVDHPVSQLLNRPNEDDTEIEWRRQLMVDLQATGNNYQGIISETPSGPPTSLVRFHPESVQIIPQRFGRWTRAYQVDVGDGVKVYDASQVMHFRYESWENGPAGMFGQGIIRALHADLETLSAARSGRRDLAKTRRPDVAISPKGQTERWNDRARESVLDSYAEQTAEGGPLVLSGNADVQFLTHSPREMDWGGLEDRTHRRVLTAAHVPPVVAGDEGANFATSQNQLRLYWLGLKMDGILLSARLTHSLGHRYGAPVWIWMDFSAVPALRLERDSQIARATAHIQNGADRQAAYEAEGLPSSIVPPGPAPAMAAPAPETAQEAPAAGEEGSEPTPDAEDAEDALEALDAEERKDAALVAAVRAAPASRTRWQSWLVKTHAPAEKRIKTAVRRYLREAAGRYERRVAAALSKAHGAPRPAAPAPELVEVRAIHLEEILDLAGEMVALEAAVGPAWRKSWALSAESSYRSLGLDLSAVAFDPDRPEVVRNLRRMIVGVTRTTADAIRVIVQDGLESGASIGAIQEAIHVSSAVGPMRALRIARTEATIASNSGTQAAYQEAESKGIDVRKVWRTAGSGDIRPSHDAMDGQERNTGEEFLSGEGNQALYPGGFGIASEDINCRCALEPRVAGGGETIL